MSRNRERARRLAQARRVAHPAICLVAVTSGLLAIGATSAAASQQSESSFRYAGYRSVSPATSASVRFTVPALTCAGAALRSVAFGVSVQTGSAPAFAGVIATCDGSQASYHNFVDLGSQGRGVSSANAGDIIEASATVVGARVHFRVADLTHKGGAQMGGTFDVRSISVGVIGIKTGAKLLGVPNFNAVDFAKVRLAGKPLNSQTAVRVQRIAPDGHVHVRTSQPTAGGQAFRAEYVAP